MVVVVVVVVVPRALWPGPPEGGCVPWRCAVFASMGVRRRVPRCGAPGTEGWCQYTVKNKIVFNLNI